MSSLELWGPQELLLGRGPLEGADAKLKMAKLSLSSVALRNGIVYGLPVTGVCITIGDLICVCVCE